MLYGVSRWYCDSISHNTTYVVYLQYQSQMSMSPSAIHDQLTSQYGDKFTQSEADYAIQHLND